MGPEREPRRARWEQKQAKNQPGTNDQKPVAILRLAQGLPAKVEVRDALTLPARTLEKARTRQHSAAAGRVPRGGVRTTTNQPQFPIL